MQSYSKGSRGLSVLPRVCCIFTAISISLSHRWRQRGSRYAIRAGRNLPDKEFRYLRTVIVTAAVYRGFNSVLAHLLLTFRHRAGVRPYTSFFNFAESCVFGKQSLPPLHCGPLPLNKLVVSRTQGHPFSLSYGAILPSSFTWVLSRALGFSPRPPVSVSGTVVYNLTLEVFPGSLGLITSPRGSYSRLRLTTPRICQRRHSYTLHPGQPTPGRSTLLRHPIEITNGTGILTCLPSATLLKPHLRDRLTLRG
jgi:hypothetical protein